MVCPLLGGLSSFEVSFIGGLTVYVCICMYVCIYVCMYVCRAYRVFMLGRGAGEAPKLALSPVPFLFSCEGFLPVPKKGIFSFPHAPYALSTIFITFIHIKCHQPPLVAYILSNFREKFSLGGGTLGGNPPPPPPPPPDEPWYV